MSKSVLFLFLFIAIIPVSFADITINEIMARPISDESLNEWIEIYNTGSSGVDIANWKIGDNNDNDTLEGGKYGKAGTVIPANGYAIITDDNTRVYDNFNVSSNAIRIYVDDASIGNGLSNSGETLYLYDNNGNLVQQITFSETSAGNSWVNINGNWQEGSATPGYSNTEVDNNPQNNPDNTPNNTLNLSICDWNISILLNKTVFLPKEFTWRIKAVKLSGDSTMLTSKVTIEDSEGITNYYSPWNSEESTIQKTSSTYTPNLKPGFYIIKSNLSTSCQDLDTSNNKDAQIFTIKDLASNKSPESFISIEEIPNKEYFFGDVVLPKITIYRGDTQKYAVKGFIEKNGKIISEETILHVENKYENLSISIPIKLRENCDNKLSEGNYTLKVTGLDKEAFSQLIIRNNPCTKDKKERTITKISQIVFYDIPSKLFTGEELTFYGDLYNSEDNPINFSVWSYLQKGTKVYGDKNEAIQTFEVPSKKSIELKLKNRIPKVEEGNYKLNIIFFDGAEEKSIIKNITLAKYDQIAKSDYSNLEDKKSSQQEKKIENEEIKISSDNRITGNVVNEESQKFEKDPFKGKEYASKSKSKDYVLYALIIILASLCSYLLLRAKALKLS